MSSAVISAADLVGVAEIADRLGTSCHTVQSWRRRHADFPAPLAELKAGPIWMWPDVQLWARQPRRRGRPRQTATITSIAWSGHRGAQEIRVAVAAQDEHHVDEAIGLVRQALDHGAWTEAEIWAGVVSAANGRWQVRLSPDRTTISLEPYRTNEPTTR